MVMVEDDTETTISRKVSDKKEDIDVTNSKKSVLLIIKFNDKLK